MIKNKKRIVLVLISTAIFILAIYECFRGQTNIRTQEAESSMFEKEFFPEGEEPQHLVVVLMDTLRADRMSVYGYERDTTPYLDSKSDEYLIFNNARAAAPWTIPSHATLFTGLLPAEHGAQWGRMFLEDRYETLAEVLSRNGFCNTALIANKLARKKALGITQGFHYVYEAEWNNAGSIVEELDASLKRAEGRKCRRFIFMNFMINHLPYETDVFGAEFGVATDPVITGDDTKWQVSAGKLGLSPDQIDQFRRRYDASVRFSDVVYQDVIETLKKWKLYENALVAFVSDHGDGLAYHQELGHAISSWEEQLHVPLLLHFPGGKHAGVMDKRTSLSAFPSTVLKWMNIKRTDTFQGRGFLFNHTAPVVSDYRSYFTELGRGFNQRVLERYPSLEERVFHQHVYYCDDYKLIARSNGAYDLYDLLQDPLESNNLFDKEVDRLKGCQEQYQALLEAGKYTNFEKSFTEEEKAEIEEKTDVELLKSLGYL